MNYSRFVPNSLLHDIVECYWIVDGTDRSVQKIIPDGCSELIFHFGDPYKISSEQKPEALQSFSIAAGQIDQPIFLKPTGRSGVLGVKFKPLGMWKMLGCDMQLLRNQTYHLGDVMEISIEHIVEQIQNSATHEQRINTVETFLIRRLATMKTGDEIGPLINEIKTKKGQVSVRDLSGRYKISNRKMERLFLQQVGVSAKLYSRLIRFSNVYNLVQQPSFTKAEATYLSGYFDQAHFNKEFREFTGENPEEYFSGNHTFSNFFLKR
jgi:AraC-like DNA-binding protein